MQSTSKTVVWIVVGIFVIGGLYYWYTSRSATAMPSTSSPAVTTTPAPQQPVSTLPSGADTSDAALSQDASAMSGYMSAMNSDAAAINAGMTDKPVSQ